MLFFDGIFVIMYVGEMLNQGRLARRLIYVEDDLANLRIVAIELTGDGAQNLPKFLLRSSKEKDVAN